MVSLMVICVDVSSDTPVTRVVPWSTTPFPASTENDRAANAGVRETKRRRTTSTVITILHFIIKDFSFVKLPRFQHPAGNPNTRLFSCSFDMMISLFLSF